MFAPSGTLAPVGLSPHTGLLLGKETEIEFIRTIQKAEESSIMVTHCHTDDPIDALGLWDLVEP